MKHLLLAAALMAAPIFAHAQATNTEKLETTTVAVDSEPAELDPFAADVEDTLGAFDSAVQGTGESTWLAPRTDALRSGCYRQTCKVWALVEKSEQTLYLYIDGNPVDSWLVSSGAPGHDTPDFDRHPNGRIYDSYDSTKFPEGDYKGLGNMPYAVFIEGGFALHGTPQGSWKHLGHRASHGCIRQHPDNAYKFNRLVRKYGISNVWITVR